MASNRPRVRCPHCEEHLEAEKLPPHRKYRNEFRIDVFECPECHKNFKFDPREYFITREGIENGDIPSGVAIEGVKVDELLPSEKMVIDYDRRPRAPWRRPAMAIGIIVVIVLAYLIFK